MDDFAANKTFIFNVSFVFIRGGPSSHLEPRGITQLSPPAPPVRGLCTTVTSKSSSRQNRNPADEKTHTPPAAKQQTPSDRSVDKRPVPQKGESSPGKLNRTVDGLEVYQQLLMVIDFCNNPTLLLETLRGCKVALRLVKSISQPL